MRGISALSVKDHWTQTTENNTTVDIQAWLHLYRNPIVAERDADKLHRDVLRVLKLKNDEVQAIRLEQRQKQEAVDKVRTQQGEEQAQKLIRQFAEQSAKNPRRPLIIDDELWRRTRRFLCENKHAKDNEPVWSVKYDALKKAVALAGCHDIRSNAVSNAVEAWAIYRQRDIIEQGFNQLKNEVGGSRFEATESSYRGKLFVYSLAQAIRMHMLYTARHIHAQNSSLKMPEESLRKLFTQLHSVQARRHRTTRAFVIGSIAKRHRDLLALLGFENKQLPKTLYR